LAPPDDERLDDLTNDADDAVYLKGLKLAEEIRGETSQQGRKRHPSLALLKIKQQQHDESSSNCYRASTIRPLGGGVLNSATTYTPTATDTEVGAVGWCRKATPQHLPTTTTTTTTSLDLATDGHLTEQTDVKTRVVRLIRDIERTAVWQLGEREDMTEQNGRQSLSASLPLLKCHSQGV
jgi:hypothetical protein